jgi:hypothetical protein
MQKKIREKLNSEVIEFDIVENTVVVRPVKSGNPLFTFDDELKNICNKKSFQN